MSEGGLDPVTLSVLASALSGISERRPIVSLLHITLLGMGKLSFEDVRIDSESLPSYRPEHSPEPMGRMPSLKAHDSQSATQGIPMQVRIALAGQRRKHKFFAFGVGKHLPKHLDGLGR